jgi:hypothetical protein
MDGCMELLAWNYAIKNLMGYHLLPTINLIHKKLVLLPLRVMPFGVLGSSGLRLMEDHLKLEIVVTGWFF